MRFVAQSGHSDCDASLYINVFYFLSSFFPMSYHRVLPPPPALANPDLTRHWLPTRHTLLQNRFMADVTSKTNQGRGQVDIPRPRPSCRQLTKSRDTSPQLSECSEEDVPTSPNTRSRSSANISNEDGKPSQPNVNAVTDDSTRWNAPSSICLCQPDPKVPRPRNGM